MKKATRKQVLFWAKLTQIKEPLAIIQFKQLTEREASSEIGRLQVKRGKKGALRNAVQDNV